MSLTTSCRARHRSPHQLEARAARAPGTAWNEGFWRTNAVLTTVAFASHNCTPPRLADRRMRFPRRARTNGLKPSLLNVRHRPMIQPAPSRMSPAATSAAPTSTKELADRHKERIGVDCRRRPVQGRPRAFRPRRSGTAADRDGSAHQRSVATTTVGAAAMAAATPTRLIIAG